MNDNADAVVKRAHEIVARFQDLALQREVIEQMQRDGIIDEHGRVICLEKPQRPQSTTNGAAK